MIDRTSILQIRFSDDILFSELPEFRGAIISKVPQNITLFHNHLENGLRYKYPLIQYKRIKGKAAIICLGEGTEAIGNFFAGADFNLRIGKNEKNFTIDSVKANQWIIQTWNNTFTYTIRKWLPFNSDNYKEYSDLEGVVEKISMLEKLLIGNILSMCTGLNVHIEKEITCKITEIIDEKTYMFKGVRMHSFDLKFNTNIYLFDYIGLGKGVSHGFGIVKQYNNINHE